MSEPLTSLFLVAILRLDATPRTDSKEYRWDFPGDLLNRFNQYHASDQLFCPITCIKFFAKASATFCAPRALR
jgi:hypothetical protein